MKELVTSLQGALRPDEIMWNKGDFEEKMWFPTVYLCE